MERRISSITFRLLAFGPLALLLLLTQTAEAVPQLPRAFYGTVDVGASPADDGLVIEARLQDGQVVASGTTGNGTYGQTTPFRVRVDDPDTAEKEGAALGESIFFFLFIGSVEQSAFQNENPATLPSGFVIELDLSFPGGGFVVDANPAQTAEGSVVELTGSFAVSPPNPDFVQFECQWAFGDGTSSGPFVCSPSSNSVPTVEHVYPDNGAFTATLTVEAFDAEHTPLNQEDIPLDQGSDTATVTVSNVDPTVDVGADVPDALTEDTFTLNVTFTDPGFDCPTCDPSTVESFTATVNWGDGSVDDDQDANVAVSWTTGSAGTPTAGTIEATHIYTVADTYTVTVTVSDDDGGVGADSTQVTASVPQIDLFPVDDQVVDEGIPIFSGQGLVATFTDLEPTATHTATIRWGDGSSTSTSGSGDVIIIEPDGETPGEVRAVLGHIYGDNGTYRVRITVRRAEETSVRRIRNLDVTVNNVAPVASIPAAPDPASEGDSDSPVTVNAVFGDQGFDCPTCDPPAVETFTTTVEWGDGTVDGGSADNVEIAWATGSPGAASQGAVSASHTYADNGIYTITVTVQDDDGGVGTITSPVTVNNVAPILVPGPPQAFVLPREGQVEFLSQQVATFTDPGFDCPTCDPPTVESFTAIIDWDDGTVETDQDDNVSIDWTTGSLGTPTTGTVTGSHLFTEPGVFEVVVTVTDDDAGQDSTSFTVSIARFPIRVDAGPPLQERLEIDPAEFFGSFGDPEDPVEWIG